MKWFYIILINLTTIFSGYSQVLWEEHFDGGDNFTESEYAHYLRGEYHIYAKNGRVSYYAGQEYSDVAIQIKTEFMKGSENQGYGFIFRAKDYDNFYVFCISASGSYFFSREQKNELKSIIKWTESSLIKQRGVNYLSVSCNKSTIELFINGVKVNQVQDGTFQSGKVGVIAYSDVHAHFDDLMIYKDRSGLQKQFDQSSAITNRELDYSLDESYLYVDNFDRMSSGWSESDNAHYENGFYTLWNKSSSHFSWLPFSHTDYDIEANIKINHWESPGFAGVLFRTNKIQDFYLCSVSNLGETTIERRTAGVNVPLHQNQINSFDPSGVIKMRVQAKGSEIQYWINDELMGKMSDPGTPLKYSDFGFAVSKGVQLFIYSICIREISFSLSEYAAGFFLSPGFLSVAAIFLFILVISVLIRIRNRKKLEVKIYGDILNFIINKNGSVTITGMMQRYNIDMKSAEKILDDVCVKHNGQRLIAQDGNDIYDFPEYFSSGKN